MATIITSDVLKQYFNGQKAHRYYTETVRKYQAMRFHANAECYNNELDAVYSQLNYSATANRSLVPNSKFNELILERRPNESDDIKDYRQKIYKAQTKNPVTKVINSLSKIRRSPDWKISYEGIKWPARIIEEETLEYYTEKNYPGYTSFSNWLFKVGLKNYCIDANAVIANFPMNLDIKENEFYRPVATLFNSEQVIYFEEGAEYCILQSAEFSDFMDGEKNAYQLGKVFYLLTKTELARYDQTNASGDFNRTKYLVHNLGYIPAFKIPGTFLSQKDNTIIQESPLAPMLEHLDEAAREYSDLQAAKVLHMYPLMWYYNNKDCGHCGGTGKVINQNNPESGPQTCSVCNGTAKVKFSPYALLELDPPNAATGSTSVPVPPAGYVNRDVEIIKHQEESVEAHIYKALAALNMQFLDQTPLNISGEAKNVDREELNNFVYGVAEDLVFIIDSCYKQFCDWRYSFAIPSAKERDALLPKIPVPQNFDLLPTDYLIKNITDSKTNKLSPILIGAMETDYAEKTFYACPDVANLVGLAYKLDTLPGLSDDEKMVRLSNKGITNTDYIISCNLLPFIRQALLKDENFEKLSYEEQLKQLQEMAAAKEKEISAAQKVIMQAQQQLTDPANPQNQPGN